MKDVATMAKAELVAEAAARGLGTRSALAVHYRSELVAMVRKARTDEESR